MRDRRRFSGVEGSPDRRRASLPRTASTASRRDAQGEVHLSAASELLQGEGSAATDPYAPSTVDSLSAWSTSRRCWDWSRPKPVTVVMGARKVERRVSIEVPVRHQVETGFGHRHDRPLLDPGYVVRPDHVPHHDVGVVDVSVGTCPPRQAVRPRGSATGSRLRRTAPWARTASPTGAWWRTWHGDAWGSRHP